MIAASAVLLALLAVVWLLSSAGVDKTIRHAREIERSFALASSFVERFKEARGHLPSEAEFSAWADARPDGAHGAKGMRLLIAQRQFPAEVINRFGPSPPGGYIVEMWRGEWFEYFASWADASTLEFDARKFYFSGSALIDGLAILLLSIVLGVVSRRLWPRPTLRAGGDAPTARPSA